MPAREDPPGAPAGGRISSEAAGSFLAAVNDVIAHVGEMQNAAEAGRTPAPESVEALGRKFESLILAAGHLDEIRGRNLEAVRAQEDERARIAREVHDGPAQLFAGFVHAVEYAQTLIARGADTAAVQKELETLKADIRRGLAELRRFIFHLRPPALQDLGLVAAIRQVADEASRMAGLAVEVQADDAARDRGLPPEVEVSLFRIAQEAIQNAVKHARAKRVVVRIKRSDRGLVVEVEDDGRGLEATPSAAALLEGRKLGLIGMRERADLVGGRLAILSSPGGGTLVRAEIGLTGRCGKG